MPQNINYAITSARHSAERLGLVKIDELIAILIALVAKLDADAGVTDTNYNTLLTGLKTMRTSIGVDAKDFKDEA